MKTRTGKIARLPRHLRDQLNNRLEAAEPGSKILEWLNGRPEVKRLLEEEFGGDAITPQNLSHWRQAGFRDWLAREDLRAGLGGLREFTEDWEEGESLEIIDDVAAFLAARFAALLSRWDGEENQEFAHKARLLSALSQAVVRLQEQMHKSHRDNHEFERRLVREQEEEKVVLQQQLIQPFYDKITEPMLAEVFGGGPAGLKIAKFVQAVRRDRLDSPEPGRDFAPDDKFADPGPETKARRSMTSSPVPKSNQIQPSPTMSHGHSIIDHG